MTNLYFDLHNHKQMTTMMATDQSMTNLLFDLQSHKQRTTMAAADEPMTNLYFDLHTQTTYPCYEGKPDSSEVSDQTIETLTRRELSQ